MYGKTGWTIRQGVFDLVNKFLQETKETNLELPSSGAQYWRKLKAGQHFPDYLPFSGLDAQVACKLLTVLSSAQLQNRQNLSPPLKQMLEICTRHPRKITLGGYLISPTRIDERITVESLLVSSSVLEVNPDTQDKNSCWEYLRAALFLTEAKGQPAEMVFLPGSANNGQWWLWWD